MKTSETASNRRSFSRSWTCRGPVGGSDDLLLQDLLRSGPALLRALVLVVRREPVSARVAHDRVRGDHRPARGARDLAGLALRLDGFGLGFRAGPDGLHRGAPRGLGRRLRSGL